MAQCKICEKDLDLGACNQTYTIITVVSDSDATGTKKDRFYLCEDHTASLRVWVAEGRMKAAIRGM